MAKGWVWRATPPAPIREQQWRPTAHVQHRITPSPCCSFTDALPRYYSHSLHPSRRARKICCCEAPFARIVAVTKWTSLSSFNWLSLYRDGNIPQDAIPAAVALHATICLFVYYLKGDLKDCDWRLIWDESCLIMVRMQNCAHADACEHFFPAVADSLIASQQWPQLDSWEPELWEESTRGKVQPACSPLWDDRNYSGFPGGTFKVTSRFFMYFFFFCPISFLFCSFMPVKLFLLSFITHWTTELAVFCCLKCNLSKINFKVFIFRPSLWLLCTTEESRIRLCFRWFWGSSSCRSSVDLVQPQWESEAPVIFSSWFMDPFTHSSQSLWMFVWLSLLLHQVLTTADKTVAFRAWFCNRNTARALRKPIVWFFSLLFFWLHLYWDVWSRLVFCVLTKREAAARSWNFRK